MWAQGWQHVLRPFLNSELEGNDFREDRLTIGLDLLSDDKNWVEFEVALNQRTLRVYALEKRRVRLGYDQRQRLLGGEREGTVPVWSQQRSSPRPGTGEGVLAALDPLGMPLVAQVVSGEKADDPLYIPAIDEVRKAVDESGLLYVGDSKMMSLATRAHLVAGSDCYLGALALTPVPQATIDAYLAPV